MSDDTQTTGEIVRINGKFAPGTQPANLITSANARSMAQKRWRKAEQKAGAALLAEVQSIAPSVTTPTGAYAFVVAKQAIALIDSDKPRFDDVQTLGQIIGLVPRSAQLRDGDQAPHAGITLTLDAGALDAVRMLLDAVSRAQHDIVDGTVHDIA